MLVGVFVPQVVISDFPDPALVNNLAKNVEININALGDEPRVADATAMVRRSHTRQAGLSDRRRHRTHCCGVGLGGPLYVLDPPSSS